MKVLLDLKCINLDKAIQTWVTLSGNPRVEGGWGFVCLGMPGIFNV